MAKLRDIPSKSIQGIILKTLLAFGGKATPVDLYDAVGTEFPNLTRNAEKNLAYNVRWARMSLGNLGLVTAKNRGTWVLTAAGRRTAQTLATFAS